MQVCSHGQTVCVVLNAADRSRLEAIASDRNRPRKYVDRARVVLASVGGQPAQQVAREAEVSRPMVWRWQQRFAEAGPNGLLGQTRKPGRPRIPSETVARVVALTCGKPPPETTHWRRAMAKIAGISLRSVQRIWDAHQLQPHRVRSSSARAISALPRKWPISSASTSVAGHTVVLSIDEKSQSRRWIALSRGCR